MGAAAVILAHVVGLMVGVNLGYVFGAKSVLRAVKAKAAKTA